MPAIVAERLRLFHSSSSSKALDKALPHRGSVHWTAQTRFARRGFNAALADWTHPTSAALMTAFSIPPAADTWTPIFHGFSGRGLKSSSFGSRAGSLAFLLRRRGGFAESSSMDADIPGCCASVDPTSGNSSTAVDTVSGCFSSACCSPSLSTLLRLFAGSGPGSTADCFLVRVDLPTGPGPGSRPFVSKAWWSSILGV